MRKRIALIRLWVINKITMLRVILTIVVVFISVYLYRYLNTKSSEVVMQVIGFVVTLFSAMMIVVELRNAQKEKKSEYLVELNNYFHGHEILMKVYSMLEEENRNRAGAPNFKELGVCDFAAFCSFFENIAFLISNKQARICDIDDLFGYRFFSMMHCPYIQETLILPTSSSWQKIFELYAKWTKYRRWLYTDGRYYGMKTIREENKYTERYLKEKLYMYDRGYEYKKIGNIFIEEFQIELRTLTFQNVSEMLQMQSESIPEDLNDQDFYPLQRSEAIEAMHKDYCIGAFADNKLVGFCILILNDNTTRNLAIDAKVKKMYDYRKVLTFDYVIVHPDYRRRGIHKSLIKCSKKLARE